MKNLNSIATKTLCLFFILLANVNAQIITATATGNVVPLDKKTISGPAQIINGDFIISDLMDLNRVIGDGHNEITSWVFDFREIPGGSALPGGSTTELRNFLKTHNKLCSAIIALEMTPGRSTLKGEVLGIVGLNPIGKNLPFRQSSPKGVTKTVVFDLLSRYTSDQINNSLKNYPFAEIYMTYYANTLISNAALTLEYANNGSCLSAQALIDQITKKNLENVDLGIIDWADNDGFLSGLDNLLIPGDQFLPGHALLPGDAF